MHRLTILEHYIVCDVNEIVYRAHAACAQALSHPSGRRAYLYVLDVAAHISRAELFVVYLYRHYFVYIAVDACEIRLFDVGGNVESCSGFSRQTDNRKAVGAVRGYLKLYFLIVEADSFSYIHADGLVAVVAEDKNAVLYRVREIMQGKPQLVERAKHTVRSHAAQLALSYLHLFALVKHGGLMLSGRHIVAYVYVLRACNYLDRLSLANVYLRDEHMVRIGVALSRKHLAYYYVREKISLFAPALYLRA